MEAGADGRRRGRITIIKSGKSANQRNYSESVLRQAAQSGVYTGLRMFVDHSDKAPLKRSVAEMVSAVESTEWNDEKKAIDGTVVFFDPAFADKVGQAHDFMGVSVNHLLRGHRVRQTDGSVVEEITSVVRGHSVDWVVYPAAGGEFQQFLESEEEESMIDWTKITVDELRKNAPDLAAALARESEDDSGDEQKPAVVTQEAVQSWVREAIQADRQDQASQSTARTAALATLNDKIQTSGLPVVTRDRITRTFTGMGTESITDAAITAAIDEAKAELKALKVGPQITGMGATESGVETPTTPVASGPSLAEAQESVSSAFGGFNPRGTQKDAGNGGKEK